MKKLFPIFLIPFIACTSLGCFHKDDEHVDGGQAFLEVLWRIVQMTDPNQQIQSTKIGNDGILINGTVSPDGTTLEDRAFRYQSSTNSFKAVDFSSSINEKGRSSFSQTLVSGPGGAVVPSGSVLIMGGINSKGITNSAAFYDPNSNAIVPLGNLKTARYGHTVTEIKNSGTPLDGQFLVIGGGDNIRSGHLAPTVELFDPMTGTFSTLNASLNKPREGHTATALADGRILITGGRAISGITTSGEIFDPATGTFTLIPNAMSDERAFHTATYLDNKTPDDPTDDAILIVGGQDSKGVVHDTADFYNPATGLFQRVHSVTQEPLYHHKATALPLNSPHDAVVTGGITKMISFPEGGGQPEFSVTDHVEVFNYTFTTANGPDGFFAISRAMLKKRAMHTTDSVGTNTLVILGGMDTTGLAHTTGEEYDY